MTSNSNTNQYIVYDGEFAARLQLRETLKEIINHLQTTIDRQTELYSCLVLLLIQSEGQALSTPRQNQQI